MRQRLRVELRAIAGIAVLLSAAVLNGCGSSSDDSSGAATTTIQGTVTVPRSEGPVVQARRPTRPTLIASLTGDLFGRPAEAAPADAWDEPLPGATVVVVDRITQQPLSSGAHTDSTGHFTIADAPQKPDLELRVEGPGAVGTLRLKALIPGSGTATVDVDEISTVGAVTAEEAESVAGLSPADAETIAQKASEKIRQSEQADIQAGKADHVPDLHEEHAEVGRLPASLAAPEKEAGIAALWKTTPASYQKTLEQKLKDLLVKSDSPVRQQVLAAIAVARLTPGNQAVLNPDWIPAFIHGPAVVSDTQMATALQAGGVTGASAAAVDAALLEAGKLLNSTLAKDKIPDGIALLVALAPGPMQVNTPASLDKFVAALTGQRVGAIGAAQSPDLSPPAVDSAAPVSASTPGPAPTDAARKPAPAVTTDSGAPKASAPAPPPGAPAVTTSPASPPPASPPPASSPAVLSSP